MAWECKTGRQGSGNRVQSCVNLHLQASEAASVLQSSLSLTASGAFSEGALSRQSSQAVPGLQPSQGRQQTSQASQQHLQARACMCMQLPPPAAGLHDRGQAKCRPAGLWSLKSLCPSMRRPVQLRAKLCIPLCLMATAVQQSTKLQSPFHQPAGGAACKSCAPAPESQPAQLQAQLWSYAKHGKT